MFRSTAEVHEITCPHCKQGQYFIYPHTSKICAAPECGKEFQIEYTVELLKKILDKVLLDIEKLQVTRNSAPRRHFLVKMPDNSGWKISSP